jgi:hypothetical protein
MIERIYVKRVDVQGFFARILGDEQNRMDPQLMADAMVQIIPKETGLFRNVVPQLADNDSCLDSRLQVDEG